MEKGKQKQLVLEVNELDKETSENPRVKELTDSINSTLKKCQENKAAVIFLMNEPETSVSVLSLMGNPIDVTLLLSKSINKIPGFRDILTQALSIANIDKVGDDFIQEFKRIYGKEKDDE